MTAHKTDGDNRTVAQEYRGYILDGGGYDWDGNKRFDKFGISSTATAPPYAGGHIRLSPAFKEVLCEVDAMIKADAAANPPVVGVDNMPDAAGIKTWLNDVAKGYSQKVDGAGLRMFYILEDLATTYNEFGTSNPPTQTSEQLLRTYLTANMHPELPSFRHLHLVDRFGNYATAGLGYDDLGAAFAVDRAKVQADGYAILMGTYAPAYIAHEIHHTIINETGDLGADEIDNSPTAGEHFNDTNGNGTGAETDDQNRVLWNYRYFIERTLQQALPGGDPRPASIEIDDVTGLPTSGHFCIGIELFTYTGIDAGQNLLTGCSKVGTSTAYPRQIGHDVLILFKKADSFKQIQFGLGTTQYVNIP